MALDELNRRIRGDWFEIRETYDNLYELEDVFNFSVEELSHIVNDLRISVEEGVTEYKQTKFGQLLTYLDSLKYDAKGFDELIQRATEFSRVLYVVLIQRLIAKGALSIRGGETDEPEEQEKSPEMGMKEILEEIQERAKINPGLLQHFAVKNIFMQVNKYKRELANMKKLAPNILEEKRPAFYANFKKSFASITEKIRDQYRIIQKDDELEAAKNVVSSNPLRNHDLSELETLFDNQGKEFSLIRSTLSFAGAERYKTRDILDTVSERKERVQLLMASETSTYHKFEPRSGGSRALSRAFGSELINVITRQITRMS